MENSIENVKSQAWEFLEKCRINKLSMNLLELNNLNLGFKILSYSEGQDYIKTFNLIEYSKSHKGFTTCFNGDIFIFYDDSLTSSERNFTIAHEIGHIILSHTSSDNIIGKSNDENIQNQQEKEADVFAYSLLAPAPVLLNMKVYSPLEISRLTGLNTENSQMVSSDVGKEESFVGKGINEKIVRLFNDYIQDYLQFKKEPSEEKETIIIEERQHINEQTIDQKAIREEIVKTFLPYINEYQRQEQLKQEQLEENFAKEQEKLKSQLKLSKIKYACICICSLLIFGSSIMYFFITQNIKNNSSLEDTNVVPNQIIQNDMPKVEDINIQDLHNNVENENIENIENEISELQQENTSGKTVFITPTGKKYHKESCRYANKNSVEVSIEQAKELNLLPCNLCNPDD